MANLAADLAARVCIVTVIYAVISYFAIQKLASSPDKLVMGIPALFVMFGAVLLIGILFTLRTYHVWNAAK